MAMSSSSLVSSEQSLLDSATDSLVHSDRQESPQVHPQRRIVLLTQTPSGLPDLQIESLATLADGRSEEAGVAVRLESVVLWWGPPSQSLIHCRLSKDIIDHFRIIIVCTYSRHDDGDIGSRLDWTVGRSEGSQDWTVEGMKATSGHGCVLIKKQKQH